VVWLIPHPQEIGHHSSVVVKNVHSTFCRHLILSLFSFSAWFYAHRMSMAIVLYCLVVALLASAVVQVSTGMPFTSFRDVLQSAVNAFNI
jgi:hypothetical protein